MKYRAKLSFRRSERSILQEEEVKHLVSDYRDGSKKAYDTLIERNMGLVVKHASQFFSR